MGLGSAGPTDVSSKDAGDKAAEARRLLSEGKAPLTAKRQTEKAQRTIPTFGALADEYIATHKSKFRKDKHIAQWETTLGEDYCRAICPKPLNEIDTEAVLTVLQPIWTKTKQNLLGSPVVQVYFSPSAAARTGPNSFSPQELK